MWTVADLEEIWFSANCSTSRCVVAASGGGLCQWSRGISEGQEIQHFGHDFHQIWTCAWLCSIHPGRLGWWFDCGGAPKISQHLLRHRRKQSHCMYPTAGRCEADCRGSSRQGPVICNLTMNSARRVKICSMICHIYVRITNLLWQKFANCNRKDKTMPDNRLQHLDLYIVGLWKIMNVECWMICSLHHIFPYYSLKGLIGVCEGSRHLFDWFGSGDDMLVISACLDSGPVISNLWNLDVPKIQASRGRTREGSGMALDVDWQKRRIITGDEETAVTFFQGGTSEMI